MDELFDSLDGPGIEAAMRWLKLVSKERTVLLTSHRSELRGLEEFTRQWIVERGADGSTVRTA